MAIISFAGDSPGILYNKSQNVKVRGLRPGYPGTTYLVAQCFSGGISGAVEPFWSQLEIGTVFLDGSASWRISKVPQKPSIPNWIALTAYASGYLIVARTTRLKTKGVKILSDVSKLMRKHKVPVSPFFVGSKHFNGKQSQVRRSYLRRIWVNILLGADRTAWNALATTETFDNFKGLHKEYSGWELFEYCNQGILPPFHTVGDGSVKFDVASLPPRSTLFNELPKPFAV